MHETEVSKWGNSLAVRIPQRVAKRAQLAEGDPVTLDLATDGSIVLRPRGANMIFISWSPRSPMRIAMPRSIGDLPSARKFGEPGMNMRDVEKIGKCPIEQVNDVLGKLAPLLGY
jgi:Antidote-toxin recognition MazE, bacterial antitoxin